MNHSIYVGLALTFSSLFACDAPIEAEGSAPAISGELVNGAFLEWESLRGEWLLVEFWGSWCGPCLREMPEIVRLENEYGPKGLQVFSIALEKREGIWTKVVEKYGMDWPLQMVRDIAYVRFDDLASAYGVTDIPAKFLIDADGSILLVDPSVAELEAKLETKYSD
jgi:thiol-disulfide isomerase/thioredoxin